MPNIAPSRKKHGTHVLVIGVSRYPFASGPKATPLGLEFAIGDLSCGARSASLFAAFMLNEARNPDAPLVSLHVLLSPAKGEEIEPTVKAALGRKKFAATRANVEAELETFVAECQADPDGIVVVYVVGHGMQLGKDGAVVFLEDLGKAGKDDLWGAIDLETWHKGMDERGMPKRQVWFVDACRQDAPRMIDGLGGALSRTTHRATHSEASLLFLAASTGEQAWAQIGSQTYFCEALLWAIKGAAAEGGDAANAEWYVGASRLVDVLVPRVKEAAAERGLEQFVDATGRLGDVVINRLTSPPTTRITLKLLPEDHSPQPEVELLYQAATPIPSVLPFPISAEGPAGLYLLRRGQEPPELFKVPPDRYVHEVRVG